MKTCAIIAEYNPFHNGHFHQINMIKEQLNCENVIVIMSGNFTQRGIPAICDKATRTKIALECGVSLVIELPVVFATSSAELFAKGAIKILDSLKCIDYLVYGIEKYEDNTIIKNAAKIMIENEEEYNCNVKSFKQQGLSYPAACEKAFFELDNSQVTVFDYCDLFMPNNVLALEYEKALLSLNSKIKSYSIRRKGNGYSSTELDNNFVSASAIRTGIENNNLSKHNLSEYMPDCAADVFFDCYNEKRLIYADDLSEIIAIKLMELSEDDLDIIDLTKDIYNKINNNFNNYKSVTQFVSEIKTKDYTYNRLMRVLCHVLLNVRTKDLQRALSKENDLYARVLGFNSNGAKILSQIKKEAICPIITSVKDGKKKISKDALLVFEKDIFASNVYNLICRIKSKTDIKNEYQYQLVKM